LYAFASHNRRIRDSQVKLFVRLNLVIVWLWVSFQICFDFNFSLDNFQFAQFEIFGNLYSAIRLGSGWFSLIFSFTINVYLDLVFSSV